VPRPARAALALVTLCVAGCGTPAPMPCSPLDLPRRGGPHILPGSYVGVPYATGGDRTLRFDLFLHDDSAPRPTAVILRGGDGETTIGERTSFIGQAVETMADAGYHVVLPDYSASSARAAQDDLVDLFQTLRCHASTLRVDEHALVLVGEHSGGDVALRLTAHLGGLRRGRTAQWPAPARATVVLGGTYDAVPPAIEDETLLVHGAADEAVPAARAAAVCATATEGTTCDVIEVAGASHRVENWWPSQWAYKAQMVQWLADRLGTLPAAAWPDDPHLHKRVVFDEAHGLSLDAWTPDGEGPFPAVVLVHGGGWEAGDRVTYITPLLAPLAGRGIAWFSIDYRLTPEATVADQVADVERAVAFVRSQHSRFRVDPSRLVLAGESASGHLVTHLATQSIDVAGVVSFYGVYDLAAMAGDPASPRSLARRLFGFSTLDGAARETLRDYSPVANVSAGMPPLLLVTGTADGLWPQAQAFEQALSAAGASYESIVLPDAPHGMEQWNADPRWRGWSTQVTDWIVRVTQRTRAATADAGRRPPGSSRP